MATKGAAAALKHSHSRIGVPNEEPDIGNDNAAEENGAESTGVPLGQLYKYISSEIEDERNFASIGATMLLIISFVMVCLSVCIIVQERLHGFFVFSCICLCLL